MHLCEVRGIVMLIILLSRKQCLVLWNLWVFVAYLSRVNGIHLRRMEWIQGVLFNYKSIHSIKFFERFRKREGFEKYSLHTLRKTFITKLINSGMRVYNVMNLARHRNIETTLPHYSRADLRRMRNEISNRTNMGTLLVPILKKV